MLYYPIFIIFLLGLTIGSFLDCLVWRLHKNKTILGRSMCPHCRKQIAWYDNLPLLSFLILQGKCRHCGKRISWQYPAVEFVVGVLFAFAFYVNQESGIMHQAVLSNSSLIPDSLFLIRLISDWFLIAVMTIIFIYDLKYYLILDIIALPACVIVFVMNILTGTNWQNLLISGIIGGSFFLLQFLISRGKWIGGGDIRLGLLMGLALGWPLILEAIFLAYIAGSIISIFLLSIGKKQWGSKVPLGAFLAPATIAVLFWGREILDWYWRIIGL